MTAGIPRATTTQVVSLSVEDLRGTPGLQCYKHTYTCKLTYSFNKISHLAQGGGGTHVTFLARDFSP